MLACLLRAALSADPDHLPTPRFVSPTVAEKTRKCEERTDPEGRGSEES